MPKDFISESPTIPAANIVAGIAVILGIAIFSYGSWLAWHPLGFIVGGFSITALGVLLGRRARPARRRA